jgi:hypothetical protein
MSFFGLHVNTTEVYLNLRIVEKEYRISTSFNCSLEFQVQFGISSVLSFIKVKQQQQDACYASYKYTGLIVVDSLVYALRKVLSN